MENMPSDDKIQSSIIQILKEIQRLIYDPKAIQIMNRTRDQDIVMCIGNSKSGKSTLVNHIIGNTLVANHVRAKTYKINKQEPQAPGPNISGTSLSNATVPTTWPSSTVKGLIVDAPGFDDNRGFVHDIANSFYIKEIINNAKSVKLVFICDISNILHDNIAEFAKFLSTIQVMFPYLEYHQKGVVLVFTKDKERHSVSDIQTLLQEKIIDQPNIDISNRNLVEYFYYNPSQIITTRMPTMSGLLDVNYVFQNIQTVINKTEGYKISLVSPGISDKSRIFLLEAQSYLSEMKDFEGGLDNILGEFTKTLQSYSYQTEEEAESTKYHLQQLTDNLNSIKNSTENTIDKLKKIKQMLPHLEMLRDDSNLFVKLKFVEFMDEVLKIKESKIFDAKINLLTLKMINLINGSYQKIQLWLNSISKEEFELGVERLNTEYNRSMHEKQQELERLLEDNAKVKEEKRSSKSMPFQFIEEIIQVASRIVHMFTSGAGGKQEPPQEGIMYAK